MDIVGFIRRKLGRLVPRGGFGWFGKNGAPVASRRCLYGHEVFAGNNLCTYGHGAA